MGAAHDMGAKSIGKGLYIHVLYLAWRHRSAEMWVDWVRNCTGHMLLRSLDLGARRGANLMEEKV